MPCAIIVGNIAVMTDIGMMSLVGRALFFLIIFPLLGAYLVFKSLVGVLEAPDTRSPDAQ